MALFLFIKYLGNMTLTLIFHHSLKEFNSDANHKLCVWTAAERLYMY